MEQFRRTDGDSTTNQRQCDHGRWPEANVGQQYRKGLDRLVHCRPPCMQKNAVLEPCALPCNRGHGDEIIMCSVNEEPRGEQDATFHLFIVKD